MHDIELFNWNDFIYVAYARWYATEGVAKHSSRLQPSITLQPPTGMAPTAYILSSFYVLDPHYKAFLL